MNNDFYIALIAPFVVGAIVVWAFILYDHHSNRRKGRK